MPARLADRQIRAAAALAAPTLDVRGPVSEALGRAGITVPPASEDAPEADAAPDAASARTVGRPAATGLRPTHKPFEPAAWPTRARGTAPEADPLSGLTADERRVHRLLLDALARENDARDGLSEGLSYVEKKRLGALDLSFINAELAKMEERRTRGTDRAQLGLIALTFLLPLAMGVGLLAGADLGAGGVLTLITFSLCFGSFALRSAAAQASPHRQKIYEALRELALLVDDAPVSEAVAQADRLIDRLAEAEAPAPAADRPSRSRTRS